MSTSPQKDGSLYEPNQKSEIQNSQEYQYEATHETTATHIDEFAAGGYVFKKCASWSFERRLPETAEVPWPGSQPQQLQRNVGWSSGLFDCFKQPMNALVTVVFPCLTFGQIAEIVNEGYPLACGTCGILYGLSCLIGMPWIISCTNRTALRNKFGLPESPTPDCLTHFFCECCALCQEYRELKSRCWDPSTGWHGNVMRNMNQHGHQTTTTPPVNQNMNVV